MMRHARWLGLLGLLALAIGCGDAAPPEGDDEPPPPAEPATPPSPKPPPPKADHPATPQAEPPPTPPPAPQLPEINAAYWLNSEPLTLAGLRGKVVLLEFWATWCPPCRTTIPHLVALHKAHAPQGLVIVSLTNEPKETVEPFAKQMGMTYAVGGGSTSGRDYRVRGIPHAFLIDPSGHLVWRGHPMDPRLAADLQKQLDAK